MHAASKSLTVRAVDVGYGHIKFSTGRDSDTGLIQTESFPSLSPVVRKTAMSSKVLSQRDTAIITIGERTFEVGKDVGLALEAFSEGDVLDQNFPLTDAYAARLFGALNYMYPTLPGRTIDYLVLGLPLTTIRNHAATIEKRFTGSLSINAQGHKLQVNHVEVFPQPLGSYMAYLAANPVSAGKKMPLALVIDPGFNTVDWYVIQGTTPSDMRSGAVQRGMGSVIKAIAEALIAPVAQGGAKEAQGATTKEIERRVDQSLTRGEPFTLCGHTIDLSKYMPAGNAVIEEAAQAVKNSIGLGGDIDVLVMTGGGAGMYTPAMQAQFPHHRVETLVDSAFANARGFHFLGERLARSAERATLSPVAVPA